MTKCNLHKEFFDEACSDCKSEHQEMMTSVPTSYSLHPSSNYKEFSEERARRLYEELILQYLRDGNSEDAAATKARLIIKKQCRIRNIDPWPWL